MAVTTCKWNETEETMQILVFNSGSSSLKFQLFSRQDNRVIVF